MQKVVGSNPISRFFANPLHVGGLGSARGAETKWNHPRILSPFWALEPRARSRVDLRGGPSTLDDSGAEASHLGVRVPRFPTLGYATASTT
jgi:hypothetical protein